MTKSILAVAILALSTSGASAWTHHFHHRQAMNAYGSLAAPPAYGTHSAAPAYGAYGSVAAPPFVGMGGVSSNDHTMYLRNLHDSGYDPKNDFTKSGILVTQ